MIRRSGEEAATRLRDALRAVAAALGMKGEAAELDALIGALLGTEKADLSAPTAVVRAHTTRPG